MMTWRTACTGRAAGTLEPWRRRHDDVIEVTDLRRVYEGGFEAVRGVTCSVGRGALAALLGLEEDLFVVAEAATGPEALAMARAHAPDVAVLDLQMPGADGVKVATSLRTELPACQVLTVTSHGRPGHLKRALAAGARGFVPKTVSAQRLAEIIRTVRAGNRYVDPELAADAISAGDSPLTEREAEVPEYAGDGAPVSEIAERAAPAEGAVRNHLSSAATKLGAENRHSAVRLAREQGWV